MKRMKLILVRHAAAIERSSGGADELRYLTPEGRAFFRKTARTLGKKGLAPEAILTSPLLRAVQTADILAESLDYSGPLAALEALAPGFDLDRLARVLADYRQAGELVIVGHEPDLSELVVALLGLPHGFSFGKGNAIRLTVDPENLQKAVIFKWLAAGKRLVTSREEVFG